MNMKLKVIPVAAVMALGAVMVSANSPAAEKQPAPVVEIVELAVPVPVFEVADTNKDGYLSKDEYKEALHSKQKDTYAWAKGWEHGCDAGSENCPAE